jgi:hypothetical protein
MAGSTYVNLQSLDKELAIDMAELADDPLEWVRYSYPWGRGDLTGHSGPDTWQKEWLADWGRAIRARDFDGFNPVEPYRTSTTSGHGVGKSALVSWAGGFILSTRPHSKGIVTANTSPQLETKTWAEMTKWMKRCITRRWFRVTSGRGAMKIVNLLYPETWRLDAMAWRENMPEAFAGLHAASSTPFYIFDEASGIARIIFETAMGGMTDGEPMMFLFSNPTKPVGFFFDTHHELKHRFKTYKVDSRDAKMTNKKEIQTWIEDWGIDSDFVAVRVLGEFPMTGDKQFIPTNLVTAAMEKDREPQSALTDPIIIGVDVARFGDDETTIYVRKGRDGRSVPPIIIKGQDTFKTSMEVRHLATKLLADAVNVDGGGIGGGVIDNLRNWGVPNVNEVHFGGHSPDDEYANMATYMMGLCRTWLHQGGVTLPVDNVLKRQLTIRQYEVIESKKGTALRVQSKDDMKEDADIKESPDRSDGFCLTFAVPVAIRDEARTRAMLTGTAPTNVVGVEYDRI